MSPGCLTVSGEDREGYSTLSPTLAGTRYRVEVITLRRGTVTGLVLSGTLRAITVSREGIAVTDGNAQSAKFNDQTTVLKVVAR